MNCELTLTYDTSAYMFNVYENQLSRQTGSRNLTGPKTLPTIWHTYMKLVTKYQISAINSCWERCDEKYLGTDGRTDRCKTVYPPPVEWVYKNNFLPCNGLCLTVFFYLMITIIFSCIFIIVLALGTCKQHLNTCTCYQTCQIICLFVFFM